jgi:hypothetical protein
MEEAPPLTFFFSGSRSFVYGREARRRAGSAGQMKHQQGDEEGTLEVATVESYSLYFYLLIINK